MAYSNPNKKKITMVVDIGILSSIDEFARQNNISRTGAFCILAMESLNQKNFMHTFPNMYDLIKEQQKQNMLDKI